MNNYIYNNNNIKYNDNNIKYDYIKHNNSEIYDYDNVYVFYNFIIISFLLFGCCGLFKFIGERYNNYITYRKNRVNTPRLNYINYTNDNEYDNCSICLELNNKKSTKLNCGHIYHKKCIKEWIKTTRNQNLEINCPLCKVNII